MANLFNKQAELYRKTRPTYSSHLFEFIASKTPNHHLAWDVGTGSGQAALSLAGIFKNVVATDTSAQQLDFAPKHPNIRYNQTPPTMSLSELEQNVAARDTVDLVTVAQAFHWFDPPSFYDQVKRVLRKPHGVIAIWCYTEPSVNEAVDLIYERLYKESSPYWDVARKKVDDRYRSIDFPFLPVEGKESTGPFKFVAERLMDLDTFFTYIRSWSAYQTARSEGVELLSEDVMKEFERAWGCGGGDQDGNGGENVVRYPVHLRIGKVGS